MLNASGVLSYASVSGVIEFLVQNESCKLRFPGLSIEDVHQEIRLVCIRAMRYYDPSRLSYNNPNPYPLQFLRRCIHNHFFNMKRGTFVPNNPPCMRCELWDKENRLCIIEEMGCDKIAAYRKRMQTRAAIHQPMSLEYDFMDLHLELDVDAFILDESIRTILPKELISDYEKMITGSSSEVAAHRKTRIRSIVKELIEDG